MGELAHNPQHHIEPEIFNRQFELLHTHFDRDPDSHIFSAIWDFEIDIADLTHRRVPTDKERKDALKNNDREALRHFRPVITSSHQLLNELFTQIEFMQPADRLKEFEAGRNELMHNIGSDNAESDHFIYETLDRLIRLHTTVKTKLNEATDTYFSDEYWEDPNHRKGLRTDDIELLYDYTEPYEGQGLLKALDDIEDSRAFSSDITFEAKRIARIMVARESNLI